jgi:hypothetical protein
VVSGGAERQRSALLLLSPRWANQLGERCHQGGRVSFKAAIRNCSLQLRLPCFAVDVGRSAPYQCAHRAEAGDSAREMSTQNLWAMQEMLWTTATASPGKSTCVRALRAVL